MGIVVSSGLLRALGSPKEAAQDLRCPRPPGSPYAPPLGPQLACPAGCLLEPWPPSGTCLGGREAGCRTCTCARRGTRGPGRPGLARSWRGSGQVSPKGKARGVSAGGSGARVGAQRRSERGAGRELRRLGPRLRPRGGDRRSHHPLPAYPGLVLRGSPCRSRRPARLRGG